MAFDGITIANITRELNQTLLGGRIYKIAQPESDELLLTIKNNSSQYRLVLSADASLPLVYLTESNKPSPMTAPGFCMLLRKHLQNARIVDIAQPGLERIIHLDLEHLNELGDICRKKLIVEIMGKHSNIIFCDDQNRIIDSIKHISGMVSSVREVLPGRDYFIPQTQEKWNPLRFSELYTKVSSADVPNTDAFTEEAEDNTEIPFAAYKGENFCGQKLAFSPVTQGVGKVLKFDLDSIPENAVIRFKRNGDRFKKFGGGAKSLGDYFTDKKIPVWVRGKIPLIAADSEVLAVCGVEISDRIKIDENTKSVAYIESYDYTNEK